MSEFQFLKIPHIIIKLTREKDKMFKKIKRKITRIAVIATAAVTILGYGWENIEPTIKNITSSEVFKDITDTVNDYAKAYISNVVNENKSLSDEHIGTFSLSDIPDFNGENAYFIVNDNVPFFTEDDLTLEAFEIYSELDELGRCGVAYANICKELMPTEPRGEIGHIKPTGWHTIKYNDIIDGNYLYNRCHLIGFQLAGENDNEKNLITGTRYMNVSGMLPFENQINDFVDETDYHVLYRITPIFVDKELVARGVLMEAKSIEDNGFGIQFCVYVYNEQPGIVIDHATGESHAK